MKQLILIMSLMTWNVYAQIPGFEDYTNKPQSDNFFIGEKVRIKIGDTLNFEYAEPNVDLGFELVYNEVFRILETFDKPVDSIYYSYPIEDTVEQWLHDPEKLFYHYSDTEDEFLINWMIRDPKSPKRKFLRLLFWKQGDVIFLSCLRVKWSDYEKWLKEQDEQ